MSQVTVFSCDLCKGEYREAPHPTQRDASEITLQGIGPVDQAMGNTTHHRWHDLCPKCLSQLRESVAKFVEARKGNLDVTVSDSTKKSPTTDMIDRAKQEGVLEERERAMRRIAKAKDAGVTHERNRVAGILHGEVASQQTILDAANNEDNEMQVSTRRGFIELLTRVTEIVEAGQGQKPVE